RVDVRPVRGTVHRGSLPTHGGPCARRLAGLIEDAPDHLHDHRWRTPLDQVAERVGLENSIRARSTLPLRSGDAVRPLPRRTCTRTAAGGWAGRRRTPGTRGLGPSPSSEPGPPRPVVRGPRPGPPLLRRRPGPPGLGPAGAP